MSGSAGNTIVVRSYRGSQESASAQFQLDAATMARSGYFPTAQSYAPGSWGCGGFLIALLLCIILIGFIVFIYMLVVKPNGTLTVTYEFRGIAAPASSERTCPRCAEQVKASAAACRYCGHEFDPSTIASPAGPDTGLLKAPPTAPIDPFALCRSGGSALHDKLATMTDDALRRVIAECRFDPSGYAGKWSRADLIRHIESEASKAVRLDSRA